MNWCREGIGAAIALAKGRGAVFLVVVRSAPGAELEETELLEAALEEEQVVASLAGMVCIEVVAGTATCQQFAAIYPVMVVPAIYFIDSATGVDLEITGGRVTADTLLASIARAEEKLAALPGPVQPGAGTAAPAPPETALAEAAPAAAAPTEAAAPTSAGTAAGDAALAERVAHAKQMIVQRQAEREQETEDKERNEEMERRRLGQALQEQKVRKEETELRDAVKQRRSDKEEEKRAREAVKAAIEQDRQARKVKYDSEKKAVEEQRAAAERAGLAERAAAAEVSAAERASVARIQFRLPDGRSQTKQFPADSALAELYVFVETGMETGFSSFSLSTTFPRRQLDQEDRAASLRHLQMAPSATVLVMPKVSTSGLALPGDGSLAAFLWLLLTPLTLLWAMLSSLLPSGQAAAPAQPAANRQGGMGRLRRSERDDDENNTYNGNSTQQM